MALLYETVFHGLVHARMRLHAVSILAQFLYLLAPFFKAFHDGCMIRQLGGQFCLFHVAVELAGAKRHILKRAVAAYTPRNGMLDIVTRIRTNKLGDAYGIARVKADVVLFFP